MKTAVLRIISWYQRTISPDHGAFPLTRPFGGCRFYPSCSEYAKCSIESHGVLIGFWRTAKRIVRCNPFHTGGIDMPS